MFTYTQEMMFSEFKTATIKDKKGKKEIYDNRIKFLKEMKSLKKEHPSSMRNISIKQTQFDNLILAYQAPNPRDHFYLKVFGKTYAEQKAFKVEVLELSDGEVAGIKGASIKISGDFAYGYFRTESGIHRLVRKSPFDSGSRRHTSFAGVNVYPEIDDSIEIDVNPADLRIDTYRASGAGGQHINKTDSAVRLTHEPSGVVAQCQSDRSQHKNKEKAFKVLRSRLYDLELAKKQAEDAAKRGSMVTSGDRSAKIRTYNYSQGRVTDHRINLTLYDLSNIINGDIQKIIEELQLVNNTEKLKESGETF